MIADVSGRESQWARPTAQRREGLERAKRAGKADDVDTSAFVHSSFARKVWVERQRAPVSDCRRFRVRSGGSCEMSQVQDPWVGSEGWPQQSGHMEQVTATLLGEAVRERVLRLPVVTEQVLFRGQGGCGSFVSGRTRVRSEGAGWRKGLPDWLVASARPEVRMEAGTQCDWILGYGNPD